MAPTTRGTAAHEGNGALAKAPPPAEVVRHFLNALAERDVDAAMELLADDVVYINVSTPAMHGRDRIRQAFTRAMRLPGAGFEVYFHSIAGQGGTVLTERTDVLIWGRLRVQIWVCGRFDVEDGRITLWKDYFDWVNVTAALLRGLLATAVPALGAKAPAGN